MDITVKKTPKAPKPPKAAKVPASQGIPLGVHIYSDGVAVVDMQRRDGSPSVRAHHAIELPAVAGSNPREQQISAIKTCLDQIGSKTRECILSVAPSQVINKRFEVPPKANPKNMRSAAELEADQMANWPPEERVLSLDPLPGTPDHLITIARLDNVNALVDIAKGAGLTTVAVDSPLTAWQRAVRNEDTDAVLDFTYSRPTLFVFGDPIGEQILLPASMDVDALADEILAKLVDFRSKRRIEVRTLRIVGNYEELAVLTAFLKRDAGLEVKPLTVGGAENPPWAFAVALATWSFATPVGRSSK
jgi:hypothetical protein